jgi:hypothetical protein
MELLTPAEGVPAVAVPALPPPAADRAGFDEASELELHAAEETSTAPAQRQPTKICDR